MTPDATALRAALAKVDAELPRRGGAGSAAPSAVGATAVPLRRRRTAIELAPSRRVVDRRMRAIEVLELDETEPYVESTMRAGDSARGRSPSRTLASNSCRAPRARRRGRRGAVATLAEPEEITVGDVTLSTALYRILCDEAQQHLATLDAELQTLQFDPAADAVAGDGAREPHAVRHSSHRRISAGRDARPRRWSNACSACRSAARRCRRRAQPVLARAVAGLSALSARVRAREAFNAADEAEAAEIVAELETLRQEATPEARDRGQRERRGARRRGRRDEAQTHRPRAPPPSASRPPIEPGARAGRADAARRSRRDARRGCGARAACGARRTAMPRNPTAARIARRRPRRRRRAGAADLSRGSGGALPAGGRAAARWRAQARRISEPAQALRRTLHTFKGSARMAGAMRLGELTHLMESRLLLGDALVDADAGAVRRARQRSRSHRLRARSPAEEAKSNSPLPWLDGRAGRDRRTAPAAQRRRHAAAGRAAAPPRRRAAAARGAGAKAKPRSARCCACAPT